MNPENHFNQGIESTLMTPKIHQITIFIIISLTNIMSFGQNMKSDKLTGLYLSNYSNLNEEKFNGTWYRDYIQLRDEDAYIWFFCDNIGENCVPLYSIGKYHKADGSISFTPLYDIHRMPIVVKEAKDSIISPNMSFYYFLFDSLLIKKYARISLNINEMPDHNLNFQHKNLDTFVLYLPDKVSIDSFSFYIDNEYQGYKTDGYKIKDKHTRVFKIQSPELTNLSDRAYYSPPPIKKLKYSIKNKFLYDNQNKKYVKNKSKKLILYPNPNELSKHI